MDVVIGFMVNIFFGKPILGGEEKIRNSQDNSYQVVLIDYNDLDNIFIYGQGKELIRKCYQKYLKEKEA